MGNLFPMEHMVRIDPKRLLLRDQLLLLPEVYLLSVLWVMRIRVAPRYWGHYHRYFPLEYGEEPLMTKNSVSIREYQVQF